MSVRRASFRIGDVGAAVVSASILSASLVNSDKISWLDRAIPLTFWFISSIRRVFSLYDSSNCWNRAAVAGAILDGTADCVVAVDGALEGEVMDDGAVVMVFVVEAGATVAGAVEIATGTERMGEAVVGAAVIGTAVLGADETFVVGLVDIGRIVIGAPENSLAVLTGKDGSLEGATAATTTTDGDVDGEEEQDPHVLVQT